MVGTRWLGSLTRRVWKLKCRLKAKPYKIQIMSIHVASRKIRDFSFWVDVLHFWDHGPMGPWTDMIPLIYIGEVDVYPVYPCLSTFNQLVPGLLRLQLRAQKERAESLRIAAVAPFWVCLKMGHAKLMYRIFKRTFMIRTIGYKYWCINMYNIGYDVPLNLDNLG